MTVLFTELLLLAEVFALGSGVEKHGRASVCEKRNFLYAPLRLSPFNWYRPLPIWPHLARTSGCLSHISIQTLPALSTDSSPIDVKQTKFDKTKQSRGLEFKTQFLLCAKPRTELNPCPPRLLTSKFGLNLAESFVLGKIELIYVLTRKKLRI